MATKMSPKKKQIYIVDDDESVCRALGVLLVTYGFTVDTFTSAEEFFRAVPNSVPGCLILDIHMPGLDGWETLRQLLAAGSSRPVIIISADKNEGLNEKVLKAGAAGYLQKPFNDQVLVDLINIAVKKKGGTNKTRKCN
jgi:two-component system response regulator FixJ